MRSARFRRRLEQLNKRADELQNKRKVNANDRVKEATEDPYIWVTKHAKTYNEHWVEEGRPDPYEHFPPYPYFRTTFELLDCERVMWFEKSRDLMLSWTCVAYLTCRR